MTENVGVMLLTWPDGISADGLQTDGQRQNNVPSAYRRGIITKSGTTCYIKFKNIRAACGRQRLSDGAWISIKISN